MKNALKEIKLSPDKEAIAQRVLSAVREELEALPMGSAVLVFESGGMISGTPDEIARYLQHHGLVEEAQLVLDSASPCLVVVVLAYEERGLLITLLLNDTSSGIS